VASVSFVLQKATGGERVRKSVDQALELAD
jgi:hypothetical protein